MKDPKSQAEIQAMGTSRLIRLKHRHNVAICSGHLTPEEIMSRGLELKIINKELRVRSKIRWAIILENGL